MNAKKIKIACSLIILATAVIIFSFAVPGKRVTKRSFETAEQLSGFDTSYSRIPGRIPEEKEDKDDKAAKRDLREKYQNIKERVKGHIDNAKIDNAKRYEELFKLTQKMEVEL